MTTELDAALVRATMLTELLERERPDHEITAADRDRHEARITALEAAGNAMASTDLGYFPDVNDFKNRVAAWRALVGEDV